MKELQNLHSQLEKENESKVDVLAPMSSTEFIAENDKNYLILQKGETLPSEYHSFKFNDIQDRIMELSPHGFQQLCSKIGVPMSYMRKCEPEAREYNVTHWLKRTEANNLFRCILEKDSSRLRGIMSERYSPIDDSFVVDSLNRAIANSNLENPLVKKAYTGEDMLRLQITDDKRPVVGGTTMGFYVGNSEVGLSKIYLEMGLYTYTCTNGLRVPQFSFEFSRRHVGNISQNLITDNFQSQIAGIIDNYSYMMRYMGIAEKIEFRKSKFKKYIENSKNFSLPFKDSMKSRVRSLPAKNSLWLYTSEITEASQNFREMERMNIEQEAGKYMDSVIMKEVKKGKYQLASV